ncbi:MAG: HdeD family acid-resistance protein [Dysgonomonas sp.]
MKNSLSNTVYKQTKYWWISLLIGILSIALGILCISRPIAMLETLAFLFAFGFFFSGLVEIIFAISNRKVIDSWGWSLVSGIIDLLLGIVLLAMPPVLIVGVFGFFIGFWVLFHSIWGIGIACELQRYQVKNWGWLLATAILGILLSFVFILSPIFAAGSFVLAILCIAFFIYGIFRIWLAFELKSLKNNVKEVHEKIEEIEDRSERN